MRIKRIGFMNALRQRHRGLSPFGGTFAIQGNRMKFTMYQFGLGMFMAIGTASPTIGQMAQNFALFTSGDATLSTYSAVNGNVYAGDNLTAAFGYGIQRPSLMGDLHAHGSVSIGSSTDVRGDVHANGAVTLEGSGKIRGDVVLGSTFIGDVKNVYGRITTAANAVPAITMPSLSAFTPGTKDITVLDGDLILAPGAYRHVTMEGLFDGLYLRSGTYYLRSLRTFIGCELHLDLTSGPIQVFIDGDVFLESGLDVFANGQAVLPNNVSLNRSLAEQVYFGVGGDFTINAGFLNYFLGTVHAPNGTVDVDLNEMYGSVLAQQFRGTVYLDHYASQYLSAPEPASVSVLLIWPVATRRRRRSPWGDVTGGSPGQSAAECCG